MIALDRKPSAPFGQGPAGPERERSADTFAREDETPAETQPPSPEEPDLTQARSLLTQLHPSGFGEVLATEVWMPPAPPEEAEAEAPPPDDQSAWETRQELRELGLLREEFAVRHDARFEEYWNQARDAMLLAEDAIIDPYTDFAATFADIDIDRIGDYRRDAREYGRGAEAAFQLGRAYMASGRVKSARNAFREATKYDSQYPQAWWHLGVSHLFARANADAAKALQHAVEQAPGDLRPELALGVARYQMKDYASAADHFRRQVGSRGVRVAARSMLACSLRMQEEWEDARIELGFLRESGAAHARALADQCLDCVERGEQKRAGPLRSCRRTSQMMKSLAATAAGGVWIAYALTQDLFRKEARWASLPLFVLVLVLARALRGISGKELPTEFGNAEQGLPCWQTTTWMRPRKTEF